MIPERYDSRMKNGHQDIDAMKLSSIDHNGKATMQYGIAKQMVETFCGKRPHGVLLLQTILDSNKSIHSSLDSDVPNDIRVLVADARTIITALKDLVDNGDALPFIAISSFDKKVEPHLWANDRVRGIANEYKKELIVIEWSDLSSSLRDVLTLATELHKKKTPNKDYYFIRITPQVMLSMLVGRISAEVILKLISASGSDLNDPEEDII